jgi:hypothetical protein
MPECLVFAFPKFSHNLPCPIGPSRIRSLFFPRIIVHLSHDRPLDDVVSFLSRACNTGVHDRGVVDLRERFLTSICLPQPLKMEVSPTTFHCRRPRAESFLPGYSRRRLLGPPLIEPSFVSGHVSFSGFAPGVVPSSEGTGSPRDIRSIRRSSPPTPRPDLFSLCRSLLSRSSYPRTTFDSWCGRNRHPLFVAGMIRRVSTHVLDEFHDQTFILFELAASYLPLFSGRRRRYPREANQSS